MNTMQFSAFQHLVHELTGVSIGEAKRDMLFARLSKRMHALEINSFSRYYSLVRRNATEREAFIDNVTTHETRFFRTPRIWDFIEAELLPNWPHGAVRPFEAWCAAVSSGEEAYSLAILLEEHTRRAPGFTYTVRGTDISEQMIKKCQHACYNQRSVAQFQESMPARFQRSIRETESGYRPRDAFRTHVSFSQENLFTPASQPRRYDLVMLRNVLIYFSREDQLKALEAAHRMMRDGAILIIGESEFLTDLEHLFEHTQPLVYRAIHDKD